MTSQHHSDDASSDDDERRLRQERKAQENAYRRSLISKRAKKRSADREVRKEVVDDDDELFSVQPQKQRRKENESSASPAVQTAVIPVAGTEDVSPPPIRPSPENHDHKNNIENGTEAAGDHDVTNDDLEKDDANSYDGNLPNGPVPSYSEITVLSSTPDSFADAAQSPLLAAPVTEGSKTLSTDVPESVSDAASPPGAVQFGESFDLRPLDDSELEGLILDDLTEAQKSVLLPEQLERLEKTTQEHYISRLPNYFPGISGCRNVSEYNCLNHIDEGTFGIVYRAQEKSTGTIYALKRLKLERETNGFPITSLREVNLLLMCRNHPNVVNVKEIVVGSHLNKVYLVMEYVEHDLKALIDQHKQRNKHFSTGVIKSLMRQLLSGLAFMHDNWMMHRDLKTSNLLLSHRGILKIGDFGLARTYSEPLKTYTQVVVTLWYRCPELLLGAKKYSFEIDLWSVGCIMAELYKLTPLFMGKSDADQIEKIFHQLGTPTSAMWPDYDTLPIVQVTKFKTYPYNQLRKQFSADIISEAGLGLLNSFFIYDPLRRVTAQEAYESKWFDEAPLPTAPEYFPTWPAKSEKGVIPPPSRAAPPPEPEPVEQLDDNTKELLKGLNIDPRRLRKAKGPFNIKF